MAGTVGRRSRFAGARRRSPGHGGADGEPAGGRRHRRSRRRAIDGAFRFAAGIGAFTGQARLGRAALATGDARRVRASLGGAGAGTPVAPLTARLARALDAGARDFAVTADLSAATDGARGSVKLTRLIAVAEAARA